MPVDFLQQYQIKAEPPFVPTAFSRIEAAWHQPWSEPVKVKINPRLAVALGASGLITPILNNAQITLSFESRWHQPWSEPVRIKPGLRAQFHPWQTSYYDSRPTPANFIQGWYQNFRDPVWPKKGLQKYLQLTETHPSRYLPPANVTMTISAPESNHDTGDFGVWVYTTPPIPLDLTAVNVSVSEVPTPAGAAASIKESG